MNAHKRGILGRFLWLTTALVWPKWVTTGSKVMCSFALNMND
jgi:hypothetical protein